MQTKHDFFKSMEEQGLALTFDDVRLRSGISKVMPHEAAVESRFSRNVGLKCPIVSSPMDTVTRSRMAIAMAKLGGIGVIERSLDPQSQVSEVAKVKSHLNALIAKPICVFGDQTIREISNMRCSEGYSFHSFPVVNREGKLVGLLTKNDFELCEDPESLVRETMTPGKGLLTAPMGTSLNQAYEIMRENKKKVLPLITEENEVRGMYVFSDVKRRKTGSHEQYNTDSRGHLRVAAAIGTGEEAIERALLLAQASVDVIVIDTAHGGSQAVSETLSELKEKIGDSVDLVAGNVSEGEQAEMLAKAGADGIRVGQGPGSICTTRIVAGIGCPQVTAVYNCAQAVADFDLPICADGGINNSGDITIAIGAGADCVMLGRLLAGTDESPGEKVIINGVHMKTYRGMGSIGAMQGSMASRDRYGEKGSHKDQMVPEGVEGAVPYKGSVSSVLHQNIEGLRRGMGYVGAATIEELREKANFRRISSAGFQESNPHNITVIQNTPNFTRGS